MDETNETAVPTEEIEPAVASESEEAQPDHHAAAQQAQEAVVAAQQSEGLS